MIIEQELREQIARVMKGDVSLNDLYAWLMARSWNMDKDSAPMAVELASDVEALFFARADGQLRDAELRESLAAMLNNIIIAVPINVPANQPVVREQRELFSARSFVRSWGPPRAVAA